MKLMFWKREQKENPVGPALIPMGSMKLGGAQEGRALIQDGYARNVVVYRAINEITTGIASIKFDLHKEGKILEEHPIVQLLKRPNPMNGQGSFLKEIFTNYLITGEMFIAGNGTLTSKEPKELWSLHPLDMKIVPSATGIPARFLHLKNNIETPFNVDPISGKSDVFFLKMYNPLDYWRGMPPLRAAALAADAHNEGLNWNYNLMRKGARPSGYVKGTGGSPGAETIARLKEWYRRNLQGGDNAGELLITFGDAEFIPFESTAKDMDFINGMKEFSKYVSSAFGVPLPLIDNDAASYNNMEQAKERLWSDTILPLTNGFLDAFNGWLAYYFGPEYALKIDEDCIQALEGIRQKKFERTIKAKDAGLITINEAREEVGFDKYNDPNADKLFINAGQVPLETADIGYDPTETPPPDPIPPSESQEGKKSEPMQFNVYMPEVKQHEIRIPPTVINFAPEIKQPPAPVVNVKNEIPVPSVKVDVAAPSVKVAAAEVNIPAPVVNVKNEPPKVEVKLPPRKTKTDVKYDREGNIVQTLQIETDA